MRKVLVQEAKSRLSAKVIVGISKSNHTIRSPASVAKYCARNLSKSFWVFAVDNGKVIFERDAGTDVQRRKGVNFPFPLLFTLDQVVDWDADSFGNFYMS